jgi:hypothetical protein
MDRSKKLILYSLIPVALTLFFIFQFTLPSLNGFMELIKLIKAEKESIAGLEGRIAVLKSNKTTQKKLESLNEDLASFDVEFPKNFNDEILLIDLEQFSNVSSAKIMEISSKKDNLMDLQKSEEPSKTEKKSKRIRCSKKVKQAPLVQVFEKQYMLKTLSYYTKLIEFVSYLESYQRKININGIKAQIFNDDKAIPDPRLSAEIEGSIYKSEVNESALEEQAEEINTLNQNSSEIKSKKPNSI